MTDTAVSGMATNELETSDEAAIHAVIATMSRAHFARDAALFTQQFTPRAAIYNLAPPLAHWGVDQHDKQTWMDSWEGPIEIEARDFTIKVDGDLAFCHGYMRMRGTKLGPEGRVEFWMRETLCLERTANGWRIVHEHASVPFYMDGSMRPAFDLKPEPAPR